MIAAAHVHHHAYYTVGVAPLILFAALVAWFAFAWISGSKVGRTPPRSRRNPTPARRGEVRRAVEHDRRSAALPRPTRLRPSIPPACSRVASGQTAGRRPSAAGERSPRRRAS